MRDRARACLNLTLGFGKVSCASSLEIKSVSGTVPTGLAKAGAAKKTASYRIKASFLGPFYVR